MSEETGTALTVGNQQAIETSRGMMALIDRAARDKDMDVGKLRELLAMQKELIRDQAQNDANQAFARVCKAMPRIKKNGAIDYGKGQKPIAYGKWEDVQEAIKPIYEAEGFTLSFDNASRDGGGLITTAILTHENGVQFRSSISLPLDTSGGKQNIQGMGSTSSYGNRYATRNLFNLIFEGDDDDGVRGGMKFITDEQSAEVNRLIEETGTNKDKFLETLGLATITNIQLGELSMVLNLLHTKLRSQKAKTP